MRGSDFVGSDGLPSYLEIDAVAGHLHVALNQPPGSAMKEKARFEMPGWVDEADFEKYFEDNVDEYLDALDQSANPHDDLSQVNGDNSEEHRAVSGLRDYLLQRCQLRS